MAEQIQVVTYDNSSDTTQKATLSYFEDYVLEEVIQDLMDKYGYTYETAEDKVLKGGYRIYTTMDKDIQDYLDVVCLLYTSTWICSAMAWSYSAWVIYPCSNI